MPDLTSLLRSLSDSIKDLGREEEAGETRGIIAPAFVKPVSRAGHEEASFPEAGSERLMMAFDVQFRRSWP